MVEQDYTIGDVLFKPVSGQRTFASLTGNHRGHSSILNHLKKRRSSARSTARSVSGEQRFDGIEYHALGADPIDGVCKANKEPLKIVFTRLLDLAAFDMDQSSAIFRCFCNFWRSKPRERTFSVSSPALSSNIIKTPGSPYWTAPRTRNRRPTSSCHNPPPHKQASAFPSAGLRL